LVKLRSLRVGVKSSIFVICLFLLSCVRKSEENANTQRLEDAISIRKINSKKFEVVCFDGTRETRTAQDLRKDNVCNFNRSVPLRAFCASQDQDGRAPWVLATVEQGLYRMKWNRLSFGSEFACSQALNFSKKTENIGLVCGSRDGDGRKPFTLFTLEESAKTLPVNFERVEHCFQSLENGVRDERSLLFCSSLDGDGKAPFIVNTISGAAFSQTKSVASDIWECNRSLRAMQNSNEYLK
jgi:hypothetical protein